MGIFIFPALNGVNKKLEVQNKADPLNQYVFY